MEKNKMGDNNGGNISIDGTKEAIEGTPIGQEQHEILIGPLIKDNGFVTLSACPIVAAPKDYLSVSTTI